jgi:ATP-dependent Clp protease ATP-binding subunit ClpB
MDMEKYTERVRGFIQSAQTYALGQSHQQFTPEHILKVLIDDSEGLASSLIDRSGGDSKQVRLAVESALNALPKVEGTNGQLYLAQPLAKVFATAEDVAKKAGDSFVTVERLLLALAIEKSAKTADILKKAGVTAKALNETINDIRKGRTAEICPGPDSRCPRRQAGPGHRTRRGNPSRRADPVAAHQEQSRSHR